MFSAIIGESENAQKNGVVLLVDAKANFILQSFALLSFFIMRAHLILTLIPPYFLCHIGLMGTKGRTPGLPII